MAAMPCFVSYQSFFLVLLFVGSSVRLLTAAGATPTPTSARTTGLRRGHSRGSIISSPGHLASGLSNSTVVDVPRAAVARATTHAQADVESLCGRNPETLKKAKRLWEETREDFLKSTKMMEEAEKEVNHHKAEARAQREEVWKAQTALDAARQEVDRMVASEGGFEERLRGTEKELEKMRKELEAKREELNQEAADLKDEENELEAEGERLEKRRWSIHGLDVWAVEEKEKELEAAKRLHSKMRERHEKRVDRLEREAAKNEKRQAQLGKDRDYHGLGKEHRWEADEVLRKKRAILEREERELRDLEFTVAHLTELNKEAKLQVEASRKSLLVAVSRLAAEQEDLLAGVKGMQDALGLQGKAFDSYESALSATREAMERHCGMRSTEEALEDLAGKLQR